MVVGDVHESTTDEKGEQTGPRVTGAGGKRGGMNELRGEGGKRSLIASKTDGLEDVSGLGVIWNTDAKRKT